MGLYVNEIQSLYIAYFGRPADPGGLRFWQDIVIAHGGDTSAVSAAMAQSAEYVAHFTDKSNEAIVDEVYMQVFGRHAEEGGLKFWSGLLDAGTLKIDNVVSTIMQNAGGQDQIIVNMKVSAAGLFTDSYSQAGTDVVWGAVANELGRTSLEKLTTGTALDQFLSDLKGSLIDSMRAASATDAASIAVGEPHPGSGVAVGEPNPGGTNGVAVGEPDPTHNGIAVGEPNPGAVNGIAVGEPNPGNSGNSGVSGFVIGEPSPQKMDVNVDMDVGLIGVNDFSSGLLTGLHLM